MPSGGGFIAGYNGQIAVDAGHQVIVAHRLVTSPADFAALIPLVDQTRTNLGHKLAFAEIADRFGLPTPKIGAIVQGGRIAIRDRAALSGDLFVKPEQGRGAVGAEAFRRRADGKFAIGDDTFTLSDLGELPNSCWSPPLLLGFW